MLRAHSIIKSPPHPATHTHHDHHPPQLTDRFFRLGFGNSRWRPPHDHGPNDAYSKRRHYSHGQLEQRHLIKRSPATTFATRPPVAQPNVFSDFLFSAGDWQTGGVGRSIKAEGDQLERPRSQPAGRVKPKCCGDGYSRQYFSL